MESKGVTTMKHYIQCPYYLSHKKVSITCEDTTHHFGEDGVERQINKYCEDDWGSCKYAQTLARLYETTDPAKFKEEQLKLRAESSGKEIQKLMAKNGRLENKIKERDENARMNHETYRQSLEHTQKMADAYAAQTRWTESLAAAFLVTAYDLGTKVDVVEITKDEIATLMSAYKLQITMTEDGKAFRFRVERKEKEHGEEDDDAGRVYKTGAEG